jgi:DNA modification methylase
MARQTRTVAERRQYAVLDVQAAKKISTDWLAISELDQATTLGLPEVDDRYHVWRIPVLDRTGSIRVGEVVINALTSLVDEAKSTASQTMEARLLGREEPPANRGVKKRLTTYTLSTLRNTIAQGDCEQVLAGLPAGSANLVFTSPPYYNARPEYTDYVTYEDYLHKIRRVMRQCHRVLSEGRFFVMNVSPVLIRRASRNEASRRIAVPFDMHRLFIEEGFVFVDDILWMKPEGAGWATGRGRRFAADRNPLQYKAVPVTENVLVYRKATDKLIDWNIRAHPDQRLVRESRIEDGYETTNVWRITPAHDKRHPAIFPDELAEKVIRYYSFRDDVVLDPFAGIGTVGKVGVRLGRRFVLVEQNPDYVQIIRKEAETWLGEESPSVLTLNCPPLRSQKTLF